MAQQPPFAQSLSVSELGGQSIEHPERLPAGVHPGYGQHLRRRPELPHRLRADLELYRAARSAALACSPRSATWAPRARGSTSSSFRTRWRRERPNRSSAQLHLRDLERQLDLPRGAVPVEPALPQRLHGARIVSVLEIHRRRGHRRARAGQHAGGAELARPGGRARPFQLRSAPQPHRCRFSTAPAWERPAERW